MKSLLVFLSRSQRSFIHLLRIAVFIVMAWIGGLKAFQYEADGIVPFVANSPFFKFFYEHPDEYSLHKNPEGQVIPSNIAWHESNGTYQFAYILGAAIILIGITVLAGIWDAKAGVWGGILTFGMSLVTLSFLITTPEAYVADLGGPEHGFPYLSGAGRLVVKDVIMMAAGLVIAGDSAAAWLRKLNSSTGIAES